MTLEPPPWAADALCHGATEVFFPPVGGTGNRAKAICARCPVREECLEHALTKPEPFGIWGGTSENERRRMRRARGLTGPPGRPQKETA